MAAVLHWGVAFPFPLLCNIAELFADFTQNFAEILGLERSIEFYSKIPEIIVHKFCKLRLPFSENVPHNTSKVHKVL